MTGCHTCGGYGMHHDPIAHGEWGDEEFVAEELCRCGHEHLRHDMGHGCIECRCRRFQDADEPVTRTTCYEVNAYPGEDINSHAFAVTVEYRGGARWAVRHGGRCLNRSDDDWDWESIPSERTEDWLQDHRFSLEEALAVAKRHAPRVRINGKTAAEVAAWVTS